MEAKNAGWATGPDGQTHQAVQVVGALMEQEIESSGVKLPQLPPKGYGNDGHSDEAMRGYARSAVLAERERCAKICERQAIIESDAWSLASAIRHSK